MIKPFQLIGVAVFRRGSEVQRRKLKGNHIIALGNRDRFGSRDHFRQYGIAIVRRHRLVEKFEIGKNDLRSVAIDLDLLRIEIIEPVDPAKKQLAVCAFVKGAGIELIALQSVVDIKIVKSPGMRIKPGEPAVGAHPQVACCIGQNCIHHIIRQTVFSGKMLKS